jgi:hypothetical protein
MKQAAWPAFAAEHRWKHVKTMEASQRATPPPFIPELGVVQLKKRHEVMFVLTGKAA